MVVASASLMAVLLYLDRFCLSFVEVYVQEDLGLTNTQVGWMLSAFFWTYALGQVPAGWLSDRFGSRLMLTQGKYGSIAFSPEDGFKHVPALATQVVDRVGAGDAVLCLTALCVHRGAPAELAAFLGNVVGAEAVAILGNQHSIERVPLYRHVECLLKVHRSDQPNETTRATIRAARC